MDEEERRAGKEELFMVQAQLQETETETAVSGPFVLFRINLTDTLGSPQDK